MREQRALESGAAPIKYSFLAAHAHRCGAMRRRIDDEIIIVSSSPARISIDWLIVKARRRANARRHPGMCHLGGGIKCNLLRCGGRHNARTCIFRREEIL